MQETSSLARQRQDLSFSEFLTALIKAFDKEGLGFCVLRNYGGFPTNNIGRDLDCLILPSELPRAIRALRSIQGTRIVGYTERHCVASAFLAGVSSILKARALQVDFDLSLTWKGLPYLATDIVLEAAIPRPAGNSTFFVPSPVHEAIISLFASLLVGGWLKEKYFPDVQRTFAREKSGVLAALMPQFGVKTAKRLVDSVIDGDRNKVLGCVRSLRFSLASRGLLRRPVRSALAVVRHYASEFAVRFSPITLEAVCILGPDGGGKTKIIEALTPMLQLSAVVVERRDFRSKLSLAHEFWGMNQSADRRGQTSNGSFASMAKIVQCLTEDWLSQFFGKKNLTLRICEGSYYDLLIDPKTHCYGGPMWFAQLVGKLLPSPDLWILLDPAKEGLRSKDPEFTPAESLSQLEAYRSFVKTRKSYVILDASKPIASVTEEAYAAIVDTLAQRAERQLKKRF